MYAGLSGVASCQFELDCIMVLITQAAWIPQQSSLVKAVLEDMAHRMSYSSLPQYMAYHFQLLSYRWFAVRGLNLATLLLIRVNAVVSLTLPPPLSLPSTYTCQSETRQTDSVSYRQSLYLSPQSASQMHNCLVLSSLEDPLSVHCRIW